MPDVLIVEVTGTKVEQYDEVNGYLGVDAHTGDGDWPDGLLSHTGAANADGDITVVEVWESQDKQAEFMQSRLGPALAKAGITEPSRFEWLTYLAHQDFDG